MASDPRPTILAAPSSSPTHGLLGSILSPLPSAPSSSSSTAHPTPSPSPPPPQSSFPVSQADDGRRRPARKGVVGQAERALKWVVGYDDAAPRQIGSSDYVRELTSNPGEKVRAVAVSSSLVCAPVLTLRAVLSSPSRDLQLKDYLLSVRQHFPRPSLALQYLPVLTSLAPTSTAVPHRHVAALLQHFVGPGRSYVVFVRFSVALHSS